MDILFDEGSFGFIPTENNDDDDSTAVGVFTAEIIPERFTDAASVEEECMEKASEIVIIRESAGTNNKHNTNVAEKILLPQPVVHLPSVNSRHLPSGNVETRSFRMPQDITERPSFAHSRLACHFLLLQHQSESRRLSFVVFVAA